MYIAACHTAAVRIDAPALHGMTLQWHKLTVGTTLRHVSTGHVRVSCQHLTLSQLGICTTAHITISVLSQQAINLEYQPQTTSAVVPT